MLKAIKRYTFLSKAQLFLLYSQVQQGYDYFLATQAFQTGDRKSKTAKVQIQKFPKLT